MPEQINSRLRASSFLQAQNAERREKPQAGHAQAPAAVDRSRAQYLRSPDTPMAGARAVLKAIG